VMREKGTSLNSDSLAPKPLASSVYVRVSEARCPHKQSISVMSLFPSSFSHPVAPASLVLDFQRFEGQFLLAEDGPAVTAGELKGDGIPSAGEGVDRAVRGPPAVVRKARQNFDPQLGPLRGVDD
jgi:hypothetical protein